MVNFLGLLVSQSPCYQVMVGNGDELQCTSICSKVPVTLANTQFHIDSFSSLLMAVIMSWVSNDCKPSDPS